MAAQNRTPIAGFSLKTIKDPNKFWQTDLPAYLESLAAETRAGSLMAILDMPAVTDIIKKNRRCFCKECTVS